MAENLASYARRHKDLSAIRFWEEVEKGAASDAKDLVSDDPSDNHEAVSLSSWHAFLVGVDAYDRSDISDLACPGSDVRKLRRRLMDMGVPQENITTLYTNKPDAEPTKHNIEAGYDQFLKCMPQDGNAFVFLAGHGYHLKHNASADEEGDYFAPRDANCTNLHSLNTSCLRIQELQDKLHHSRAKFCWFCVDACRTSPLGDAKSFEQETELIAKAPTFSTELPAAWLSMCACQEEENSNEFVQLGGGVFACAILDALLLFNNPADKDYNDNITFGEFQTFVEERTRYLAELAGYTQNASFNIDSPEVGSELKDLPFFTTVYIKGVDDLEHAKSDYYNSFTESLNSDEHITRAKERLDVIINSADYPISYKKNAYELLQLIEQYKSQPGGLSQSAPSTYGDILDDKSIEIVAKEEVDVASGDEVGESPEPEATPELDTSAPVLANL